MPSGNVNSNFEINVLNYITATTNLREDEQSVVYDSEWIQYTP